MASSCNRSCIELAGDSAVKLLEHRLEFVDVWLAQKEVRHQFSLWINGIHAEVADAFCAEHILVDKEVAGATSTVASEDRP